MTVAQEHEFWEGPGSWVDAAQGALRCTCRVVLDEEVRDAVRRAEEEERAAQGHVHLQHLVKGDEEAQPRASALRACVRTEFGAQLVSAQSSSACLLDWYLLGHLGGAGAQLPGASDVTCGHAGRMVELGGTLLRISTRSLLQACRDNPAQTDLRNVVVLYDTVSRMRPVVARTVYAQALATGHAQPMTRCSNVFTCTMNCVRRRRHQSGPLRQQNRCARQQRGRPASGTHAPGEVAGEEHGDEEHEKPVLRGHQPLRPRRQLGHGAVERLRTKSERREECTSHALTAGA